METKNWETFGTFESGPHRSFGRDHQTKKRFKIGLDI